MLSGAHRGCPEEGGGGAPRPYHPSLGEHDLGWMRGEPVSSEELQRIIDELARRGEGRSIAAARAELAVRLQEGGLAPPSESWLDAVAREAVHGRSYVLDAAHSRVEMVDDSDAGAIWRDAPADVPTTERITRRATFGPDRLADAREDRKGSRSRPATVNGFDLAVLAALAACLLLALTRRAMQHRHRPAS